MNVKSEIKRLSNEIVKKFHPQKVVLFGSFAYGTPNENSDIDLLVVMPYSGNELEQILKIRMSIRSPYPIDVLVKTPSQLRQRLEMGDFFIKEIIEKGQLLYESKY
jgi:uncharacterized protein